MAEYRAVSSHPILTRQARARAFPGSCRLREELPLAQVLGHSAVRAGHNVCFIYTEDFASALDLAREGNFVVRTFPSFLSPDLGILDDFGLHKLTAQQSADFYELVLNRHRAPRFVISSNRVWSSESVSSDVRFWEPARWTGWLMPAIR